MLTWIKEFQRMLFWCVFFSCKAHQFPFLSSGLKKSKKNQRKNSCRVEPSQAFCVIFDGNEERNKTDDVSNTTYTPNIPPEEGPFVWTNYFGCIIRIMHVPQLSACVQQQYLQTVSMLTVLMKQNKVNFKLVPCHRNGLPVCPFGHRT